MTAVLTRPVTGGIVAAIPSKSEVHRLLIAAALADGESEIGCRALNEDIEATVRCLVALGAEIGYRSGVFHVIPIKEPRKNAVLDCGESGSTLRFLLPVVAALGCGGEFHRKGRLPSRPLSPLYEELVRGGVTLSPAAEEPLRVSGRLVPGGYRIRADVSSQFISGMLFALPLLGDSTLTLTGHKESAPYIDMTLDTLSRFSVAYRAEENRFVFDRTDGAPYRSCGKVTAGGDFSNAAFFLTLGAIGKNPVTVTGLMPDTRQGDRAVLTVLRSFGARVEEDGSRVTVFPSRLCGTDISAEQIPDLVPVLAVAAATAQGTTVIRGAARLRLKESDRLKSVAAMLTALSVRVSETEDGLCITGGVVGGGTVSSAGDHRIAMSAAVAAAAATGPVVIQGAEAVRKSYPDFFSDYRTLLSENGGMACLTLTDEISV